MYNVNMKLEGSELVIRVDLSKENGMSGSGKNVMIGSTEGNQSVPGAEGYKIGMSVYCKPEVKRIGAEKAAAKPAKGAKPAAK